MRLRVDGAVAQQRELLDRREVARRADMRELGRVAVRLDRDVPRRRGARRRLVEHGRDLEAARVRVGVRVAARVLERAEDVALLVRERVVDADRVGERERSIERGGATSVPRAVIERVSFYENNKLMGDSYR